MCTFFSFLFSCSRDLSDMERIAEEPFQRRKSATTQGWSKPLRFGSGPQLGRSSASSGFPVHSGDFPALPCRPLPKPPRLEDMKQTVRKHENDEDSTNREAFSGITVDSVDSNGHTNSVV